MLIESCPHAWDEQRAMLRQRVRTKECARGLFLAHFVEMGAGTCAVFVCSGSAGPSPSPISSHKHTHRPTRPSLPLIHSLNPSTMLSIIPVLAIASLASAQYSESSFAANACAGFTFSQPSPTPAHLTVHSSPCAAATYFPDALPDTTETGQTGTSIYLQRCWCSDAKSTLAPL